MDEIHRDELLARGADGPIAVSALTGEGIEGLLTAIEARLARGRSLIDIHLDGADGQGLHWLYEHTEVMAREDDKDGGVNLKVRVAPEALERVRRRFTAARA